MSSASRTRTPRHAMVALVAAWALALVPTLSQALAAITGERAWAEVCTAQAARWVPVGDAAPNDAGRTATLCAWCVASVHGQALLPPPGAWRLPPRVHETPRGVAAATAASTAWVHPRPRGPPSGTV